MFTKQLEVLSNDDSKQNKFWTTRQICRVVGEQSSVKVVNHDNCVEIVKWLSNTDRSF